MEYKTMAKKGEKTSEETKKKQSESQKASMTQDRKNRISAHKTGKPGKALSSAAKAKISESVKNRSQSVKDHAAANSYLSNKIHRAVQGTMMDYLREALTKVDDRTGHKFYEDFIDGWLKEAKDNPDGQCARMLGSGLFSENTLSKLDAQVNKMMAKDIEFSRYRIRNTLFDKQRELFDNKEDPEIIAICSRRAGKSECIARRIASDVAEPNTNVLYVNLTFSNAINQLYDRVMEMLNLADVGLERASKADGYIMCSNGSQIYFRGNANKSEADKCLGYHYRRVYIDEIQSQRNMKYMINDVLSPLMRDYADSQMIYTGTPPRIPHTYCEALWKRPNIKKYVWTMFDNPYIPNKENIIQEECAKRGVTQDDSVIQREFFGNWVLDKESQVFKSRTYFTDLPSNVKWEKAYIGVDYGDADYNAVCLGLKAGNRLYIVSEKKFNRSTVTDLINTVVAFREEAKKYISEERNIMVICDHNKKDISREMALTYGMKYVYDSYKVDKPLAIAQLADFMRLGNVQIKAGMPFDDECDQIVYKRDEETDAILTELDDVFHPDMMDAVLYISRQFIVDADIKVEFHNKEAKQVQ